MAVAWHSFPSGDVLAAALAAAVARQLATALRGRGRALLAVSGGKTPVRFLRRLSETEIDWERVTVTLVDERFVPRDSPRANARLVVQNLLTGNAAAAAFADLWSPAPDVEAAALAAETRLSALRWPLDAVVLGMGADGHTASFFADDPVAELPLDPASKALVYPVRAESAGEPRLTLALARLVEADLLAIHIEGVEKRRVLEDVLSGRRTLPVGRVIEQARGPVQVFWAP